MLRDDKVYAVLPRYPRGGNNDEMVDYELLESGAGAGSGAR